MVEKQPVTVRPGQKFRHKEENRLYFNSVKDDTVILISENGEASRRRLDHKLHPSGKKSDVMLAAVVNRDSAYWEDRKLFAWWAPPCQAKNLFSVSPVPLW